MNKDIEVIDWGLLDYNKAFGMQEEVFLQTIAIKTQNRNLPSNQHLSTPNILALCEHSPVYTLGKSGLEEHLLLSQKELEERSIHYFPTNRGGDITFHGPGQVVMYPIIDLENFFTDIHRYMRVLEESVIKTLAEYNLTAGRIEGLTGVWLHQEHPERASKICAMGVKTSRWVTMHGLALNVNTDLSFFDNIIPCGIKAKGVTSMKKELGAEVNLQEVKSKLAFHFIEEMKAGS